MPHRTRTRVALPAAQASQKTSWTFLTNHSHVLICLWKQPDMRLREVALVVGITERAVQKIVQELEAGGFLVRQRVGRRNHYRIELDRPLRHPVEAHKTVRDMLQMVAGA
jgi:DNA-binding MarR family transcriptional regulator